MGKHSLMVWVGMILMGVLARASDNHFVGTWKLNVAKTDATGKPALPFKSDTIVIEAQENGLRFTFDRLDEKGTPIHFTDAARFDGKEYPTANPVGGTVSLKKIDKYSFERVTKERGKAAVKYKTVILRNGKMSMVTAQEKDARGKKVTRMSIYDKE